jgi:hypothetical protein
MTEFENFSVSKPGDYNPSRTEHHARPSRRLELLAQRTRPGGPRPALPGDRRGPPSAVLCDWGRSASTRPQGARAATRHCQRSSLGRRKDRPRQPPHRPVESPSSYGLPPSMLASGIPATGRKGPWPLRSACAGRRVGADHCSSRRCWAHLGQEAGSDLESTAAGSPITSRESAISLPGSRPGTGHVPGSACGIGSALTYELRRGTERSRPALLQCQPRDARTSPSGDCLGSCSAAAATPSTHGSQVPPSQITDSGATAAAASTISSDCISGERDRLTCRRRA